MDAQTLFLSIVITLFILPIANITLLIPILIKFTIKDIPYIMVFFTIEIALVVYALLDPIRDGGIFMQAFFVELVGIIVLSLQVLALKKHKKILFKSVLILMLVTLMGSLVLAYKPTVNASAREYPVENLDSIFLAKWANAKNEGIYLHKLIQPYPDNQKYLIYSVKKLTYEYRSVKAVKKGEILNIYITTHNAENDSNAEFKQAFIIEAGREPKQINVYLDGKKITPEK